MSYKIKVLYDYEKDRRVSLSDVDVEDLNEPESYKVDGYKYSSWGYDKSGLEIIQSDYIRDKVLWEGELEDSPVDILSNEDGDVVLNKGKLSKRLHEEYGAGRFIIKKFGGYKGIDTEFKAFVVRGEA